MFPRDLSEVLLTFYQKESSPTKQSETEMVDFYQVFSKLVCPSLGGVLATLMFAAPTLDLRKALLKGKLGDLNPFPWIMMTGNCLGWIVYGYYLEPRDAFVVAANIPGFLISLWLNFGAAKLQYKELTDEIREREQKQRKSLLTQMSSSMSMNPRSLDDDYYSNTVIANGSGNADAAVGLSILTDEDIQRERLLRKRKRRRQREKERKQYHLENLVSVPQEVGLFRVLCIWIIVLIWIHWISDSQATAVKTVGIVVNLNLVFFYGAPLQTMQKVIFVDRHSNTIHRPSLYMSLACSSFSFVYGVAKMDPFMMVPNAIGVVLGLAQCLLCFCFPKQQQDLDDLSVKQHEEQNPEAAYPCSSQEYDNHRAVNGRLP